MAIMSEKKKIEDATNKANLDASETAPVNGGGGKVFTCAGYRMACQRNGWPILSFDQWEQFGMPAAWQVYEYGKYCNNCGAQSLIPFNFEEWLQLGGPRNPTFKEPDI